MDAFDADVLIYASSAGPVTPEVATTMASGYRLRAADAMHLATAVVAGANRFITDNRRDFSAAITEIEIAYPEMLEG